MRLRSLLFTPGDRPDRMLKALESGADAVILDLEDAVSPERKPEARRRVAELLASAQRSARVFVRINPLQGPEADRDLAAVLEGAPDGLLLPKSESAASVKALQARVAAHGGRLPPVLPIATETPAAIFGLGSYREVASLLCGLTWGAEDLPAAIGAATSREPDGGYSAPYEIVRSLTLFGAHAAGVSPIDTVFPAFKDMAGLAAYAARARRDGFRGMMAIHPAQVPAINAAFAPSAVEVDWARRVLAAFAAAPGAGAVNLEGAMLDAPHRKQAERILEEAQAPASKT
ncbi:HpcH/HpaI aldolase/citrate lyase family protein [Neomegalonema perideroedes]|uniref:HpcH/HpaI aldolase/citrate lyase family protein n=1 Tax=Neomegalonema perideroedes TaxID=217219 RepID=UPI000375581A|nr:CoA ester lyase [Neomegalonema perideroedes]